MSSIKKEIFEWIKVITVSMVIALSINNFVIVNAEVPTGSMENNIMTDDRLVAFRLSYLFKGPERFDIVVFKYPDNEKELYVKRVIGLPGDTIEIKNGEVYLNNSTEPLDESEYVSSEDYGNYGPYEIPEGSYFMMGDNRANSFDSRYWKTTFVNEDLLVGKALLKYFPTFKVF